MWQRKPDGDYGGGVRWRGGVDPRQFILGWELRGGILGPIIFSVFVGSKVY